MPVLSAVLKVVAPALASLAGGPLAGSVMSWIGETLLGNKDASLTDVVMAVKDPDNLVKLQALENEVILARIKSEDADKDRQAAINLEEAKSESFWKAGARPAALWIAVLGFGYNYLIVPVCHSFGFPAVGIPADEIMWLLGGLLGLGGFRTVEKLKKK